MIRFSVKRKYWMLFIGMSFYLSAFGWSAGHDDVQRAILERLPIHLTAGLTPEYYQKLITYYSHYPDSHEGIDRDMIGEEAVERLKNEGIKRRLDLHSDKARALTFLELIRSLRENDFIKANFWIACLAHITSDPPATNHETITQLIDFIYAEETEKYTTPKGNYPEFVELHKVAIHPLGKSILDREIDRYSLTEPRDLQDALLEIMMYGIKGGHYLSNIGFDLARVSIRYADEKDDSFLPIIFSNMSKLAAWGVCRTLRDVNVAIRIANSNVNLELLESTMLRYEQNISKEIEEIDLYNDGMWRYIRAFESKNKNDIGVLVEPVGYLNRGIIGFSERKISYNIVNYFRSVKRNFSLIDVRDVLKNGFPSPSEIPLIVMPIRSRDRKYFQFNLKEIDAYVSKYIEQGGKVIWIGGTAPPASLLEEQPFEILNNNNNKKDILVSDIQDGFITIEGIDDHFKFREPLIPKVGWQDVACPFWFESKSKNGRFRRIVSLTTKDGHSRTVGAAWPLDNEQIVFLPTYIIPPFLLTKMTHLPVPIEELKLDQIGSKILDKSINILISE